MTDPALLIVLLWVAFAATHMLLSSLALRPRLVGVLGEGGFAGAYSIVALAIFVPLVATYWGHKHEGAVLYPALRSGAWWVVQYALMLVAFLLLVGGMSNQSPAAMQLPGAASAASPRPPSGIQLITRHAVFMATGVFGLAHLMVNPFATDVAFFAGFPVFAVAGAMHQDSRKLVTLGDAYRAHYEATPLIPFVGPVGRTLRGLREIPIWVYGVALVVTVGLRAYHSTLFA